LAVTAKGEGKGIVRYLRILEMALFRFSTSDRHENSVTSGGGWWQMEAVYSSAMSEKVIQVHGVKT
jgi:hypothetical protein